MFPPPSAGEGQGEGEEMYGSPFSPSLWPSPVKGEGKDRRTLAEHCQDGPQKPDARKGNARATLAGTARRRQGALGVEKPLRFIDS